MSPGFDPVAALNAASSAAPQLDPKTTVAIAQSAQHPQEAVANAQATYHFGNTVQTFDKLQGMSPTAQANAWSSMAQPQQEALKAIGYTAPNPDLLTHSGGGGGGGGNWFSDALGAVGGLAGKVEHYAVADPISAVEKVPGVQPVLHGLKEGASPVLNALGKPLSFTEHLARTELYQFDKMGFGAAKTGFLLPQMLLGDSGALLVGGPGPKAMFHDFGDVGSWAQSYRATTNGNTTLFPSAQRELTAKYGQAAVSLALRVSIAGNNMQDFINTVPQAKRQALVQQIQDPKFQELVTQVNNAKISPGRALVGTNVLNNNPSLGKALSGSIDATFDWFADPLMAAGGAIKGVRAATHGISGADAAAHVAGDASRATDLLNKGDHLRAVNYIADHFLSKGDYAGIARFDPRLEPIIPDLAKEGITDAAGLKKYFASEAGLGAMLTGKAAWLSHTQAIVPHLSVAGVAKAGLKNVMQTGLDKIADGNVKPLDDALDVGDVAGEGTAGHQNLVAAKIAKSSDLLGQGKMAGRVGTIPGLSNVARTVRQMVTLTPTTTILHVANDAPDAANFRRLIQGFLPAKRADDLTNLFIDADEGQRRTLVEGARRQMFHAAGAFNTPKMAEATEKFLAGIADEERNKTYSVGGIDQLTGDNGISHGAAVLGTQLSGGVAIPSMQSVRNLVRHEGMLGSLHVDPIIAADNVMKWWRTSVLMRPGFALRFALDENTGRLLREGPRNFFGSYLANGAGFTRDMSDILEEARGKVENGDIQPDELQSEISHLRAMALKPVMPYHPVERTLAALAESVPEGIRPMIDSVQKFYGSVLGAQARQAIRGLQSKTLKALSLNDYIDGATHMMTHQPVREAFNDLISTAQHVDDESFLWTPKRQLDAINGGADEGVAARLREKGSYSTAEPSHPLYRFKWQTSLDQIAQDKLGQAALHSLDKTRRTQLAAVRKVLEDPAFASEKIKFERAFRTPDGAVLGVDASQRDIDNAFAKAVVDHVNAHLRVGDPKSGELINSLRQEMLETGRGPTMETLNKIHSVPQSVVGPEMLAVHKFSNFFDKSWEQIVGRPADWLARQPHFVHMYSEALKETRPFAHAMVDGRAFDTEDFWRGVSSKDAAQRFDALPNNAYVRVYHATSRDAAQKILSRGKVDIPGDVLRTEGTELLDHLYVSPHATSKAFGEEVVPMVVRKGDLIFPPEAGRSLDAGRNSVGDALFNGGAALRPGALIHSKVPMSEELSEHAEQMASDLAHQRAVNRIIPYIHNPKLRTQFEDHHRILFPFLFAQRQFLQRWGRTFKDSPDAIRKLQLTVNGLQTSGVLHRDQNGNDYFYYPGAQYVQDLIGNTLNKLGIHSTIPMQVGWTGQVQYLIPGLNNPVTPSVGPFAAVAMKELGKLDPSLQGFNQAVLGQGASTSFAAQFLPTAINRIMEAVSPSEAGSLKASSIMQAIKYLDATGNGLPTKATPAETEKYVARLENWSTSLLAVRAMLGFVLPATPTAALDPKGLNSRLQTLLNELPYDQAITEYIKEQPDATAYTVSESKAEGYTPATDSTLKWLNTNQAFAAAHPDAAAWFAPRTGGAFNPAAYREQIALGLRVPKDVYNEGDASNPGFLDDVVKARASNAYYTTLDSYEKSYDATTDSTQHQQLTNQWDQWKAQFFKRNPLFQQFIDSGSGTTKRDQVMQDMDAALNDPSVPKSTQTDELRTLNNTYNLFKDNYGDYQGLHDSASTAQKQTIQQQFINWGTAYAKVHPEISDYWTTILRPSAETIKS